ncbi:MAG: FtsQ-type POTRA domain-containing protein [Candidatus Gracilibacteria bacterium]
MLWQKRKINRFPTTPSKRPVRPGITRYSTEKIKAKRVHPFVRKAKRILSIMAILGLGIFIVYGLFFSGYFNVKQVTFASEDMGNEILKEEIKKSFSKALGKNIITVDLQEFQTKVLSTFPQLEKIIIDKDYPSSLVIDFSEYPLTANVINESPNLKKAYIINSVGYIMKEDYEDPKLPYIRILSDEPLNKESPAIEAGKLKIIMDTVQYFQDKFGMGVKEVIYKPTAREIHLITERDFAIWLDIQKSTEDQLKKLKKVLVKLDIYKDQLQYIDLRIAGGSGDKIIYKRK